MSLKSWLNLLQHCFCFTFWFLGQEARGLLAPQPGIEHAPLALEMQSLNHWTTGEVPLITFKWVKSCLAILLAPPLEKMTYYRNYRFSGEDLLFLRLKWYTVSKDSPLSFICACWYWWSDSGKEAEPHGTFLSRVSVMLMCARMPEFINMHYTLCLFLFHQGFARFWSVCAW